MVKVKPETVYTPTFGIRFISQPEVKCKKTGARHKGNFFSLKQKETVSTTPLLNTETKETAEFVPASTKAKTNANCTYKDSVKAPGQACSTAGEQPEQSFLTPCSLPDVTGNNHNGLHTEYKKKVVLDQQMFMKKVATAFSYGSHSRTNGDVFKFLWSSKHTPLKMSAVKQGVLRTISRMLLENGHIRKRLDHLRSDRAENQRFDPEE